MVGGGVEMCGGWYKEWCKGGVGGVLLNCVFAVLQTFVSEGSYNQYEPDKAVRGNDSVNTGRGGGVWGWGGRGGKRTRGEGLAPQQRLFNWRSSRLARAVVSD